MEGRRRHEQADIDPGNLVYPSQTDLVRIKVGGDRDKIAANTVINYDCIISMLVICVFACMHARALATLRERRTADSASMFGFWCSNL